MLSVVGLNKLDNRDQHGIIFLEFKFNHLQQIFIWEIELYVCGLVL